MNRAVGATEDESMTAACVSLEPFALRAPDDSMAPDLPAERWR